MLNAEVILSIVLALLFLALSSPIYEDRAFTDQQADRGDGRDNSRPRILLLTAHPDDESMFFAPTLLGLARSTLKVNEQEYAYEPVADVYSLCLSSGDADGLGETRKGELQYALDFLGVRRDRRWVLDEPFRDNITEFWDAKLIAQTVKPFVDENKIDIILTFDELGVSSHPNHISLERGVRALLADTPRNSLRAFSLKTTSLIPKYLSILAPLATKLEEALCTYLPNGFPLRAPTQPGHFYDIFQIADCSKFDGSRSEDHALFLSTLAEYTAAFNAMMQHHSQLAVFRWLYLLNSRYMWVNEWEEIQT